MGFSKRKDATWMGIEVFKDVEDVDLSGLRFLPELVKGISCDEGDLATGQEFVKAYRDLIQPFSF